ncbi:MalT-like TPR region [Dillenia turbinata]|uniref:MalT-like TPR region n=1 Tax=Dillenia turbinata TaxID=194707 RepID=A0AAN8ZJS2_9MAGN
MALLPAISSSSSINRFHQKHAETNLNSSVCVKTQKFGKTKIYMICSTAFTTQGTVGPFHVENAPRRFCKSALNSSHRSAALVDSSHNTMKDLNNLESQLQELFNEVKLLIKSGKRNDAMDLLQANYDAVKEQIDAGAKGIEEAAMLDIIALGYVALGDLKFVFSLLFKLREIVGDLKNNEPLLDSVLMHMGSMYSTTGKYEESILMYQRAVQILEDVHGKNSTLLITPLMGIAKALGSLGRAPEAVESYHRAIAILEVSRGFECKDLMVPLFSLGNLLMKKGQAEDAESCFSRVLDICKKSYGENDGRVGMAMCSLAHVKCAKGNVDEAIRLYRDALQVIEDSKYTAVDDNIMEKIRIDLAELLHVVGRGKEGRKLLEDCLVIAEKYKGQEHPSSVTHLLNLATSYSRSKNFVEAERLLRTSLRIMMKTVGPKDQSVTFPMLHLAITLYHLKQDEEAERLVLEALYIREEAFGKESLLVGEALDCLVSIQTRLGKDDDELLELLKRVLKIQEKEFGYESEEVLETLKKIVFYLDKLGRTDEKFPLQRRLSVLKTKYKNLVRQ